MKFYLQTIQGIIDCGSVESNEKSQLEYDLLETLQVYVDSF